MFKRRKFLVSTIAVALFPWLAKPPLTACEPRGPREAAWAEAERCLVSLFSDLEAPRVVGGRYLALYPTEADRAALRASLIDSAWMLDQNSLRAWLVHRCTQDFRDGNTVIVDGWVLARTEARACALVALL